MRRDTRCAIPYKKSGVGEEAAREQHAGLDRHRRQLLAVAAVRDVADRVHVRHVRAIRVVHQQLAVAAHIDIGK